MKHFMTILFIMFSMIACNGAEKSQTKATANEYKFVDVDTLPEKYVEKYLYTIKWGEGKDELTFKNEEGPFIGRIDNNGNLLIIDIFQDLLKEYSIEGQLIRAIKKGVISTYIGIYFRGDTIYLVGENLKNDIICKIDNRTGEIVDSIVFDLDNDDLTVSKTYKRYILLNNKKEIIFDTGPTMGDSIGEMEVGVKLDKRTMRVGNLMSESKGKIDMSGIEITLPKQFDPINKTEIAENMIFARYLGRDKNRNLYFYANLQKPDGGGGHENYVNYVIKYNLDGKLVSIVTVRNGEIDYVPQIHYVDITPDGAIYSVMPYKDGVRVYKYEVKR